MTTSKLLLSPYGDFGDSDNEYADFRDAPIPSVPEIEKPLLARLQHIFGAGCVLKPHVVRKTRGNSIEPIDFVWNFVDTNIIMPATTGGIDRRTTDAKNTWAVEHNYKQVKGFLRSSEKLFTGWSAFGTRTIPRRNAFTGVVSIERHREPVCFLRPDVTKSLGIHLYLSMDDRILRYLEHFSLSMTDLIHLATMLPRDGSVVSGADFSLYVNNYVFDCYGRSPLAQQAFPEGPFALHVLREVARLRAHLQHSISIGDRYVHPKAYVTSRTEGADTPAADLSHTCILQLAAADSLLHPWPLRPDEGMLSIIPTPYYDIPVARYSIVHGWPIWQDVIDEWMRDWLRAQQLNVAFSMTIDPIYYTAILAIARNSKTHTAIASVLGRFANGTT